MARWTRNVGLFTGALFFAAVASDIIISIQLNEMRKGGVDTHSLAVAANAQVTSLSAMATAQNRQAENLKSQLTITLIQLRPKLVLTLNGPPQPMREPNGQTTGWFITPTWVNNGSTDAIDLWGWDSSRMFPTGVPRTFDFVNTRKLVGVLSKAVVTSGQPFLQMSKFITTDQAASIAGGKGHFIMWGYVEYREALPGNKVHHIHWCYETVTIDAGSSYIFSHPAFRPECNTSD